MGSDKDLKTTLSEALSEIAVSDDITNSERIEKNAPTMPSGSKTHTGDQKSEIENLGLDNSGEEEDSSSGTTSQGTTGIDSIISQTADTLRNLNAIKDELCRLPLDTCESEYITNSILPMLTILNQFSNITYCLANSISLINVSPLVNSDRSELKDGIHMCYKILDQSEDLYDVLKKRVNLVLRKA